MLVVYAAATFVAVRHEFFEQLDEQLHDDFETAEGFLDADAGRPHRVVRRSPITIRTTTRIEAATSGRPTASRFYRSGASAVAAAGGACGDRARSRATNRSWRTASRWRTLTGTTLVGGRAVVLRVSRSEERLREQLCGSPDRARARPSAGRRAGRASAATCWRDGR